MASRKETPQEPTFEAAMERLEAIVGEMESGTLPLEDLLGRYEEGVRLVKVCGETLDTAEQRIRTIARGAGGKPVAGEPSGSVPAEAAAASKEEGDVSLF